MRESQGLSAIRTSSRRGSRRNASAAMVSIGSYAQDARLRGAYRQSVRRRRLRSLLSGAGEGLALIFLWTFPLFAWWVGVSLR